MTHILDASVIYGSDLKTQAEVRSFEGGRLRMFNDFGREVLPLTIDRDACVTTDKGPCYFTGKLTIHLFMCFVTQPNFVNKISQHTILYKNLFD